MRRIVPAWFSDKEKMKRFHDRWPWALGMLTGCFYLYNPTPLDEAGNSLWYAAIKPIFKGTERIDGIAGDPTSRSLELPPDDLFGPMEFNQQMNFLLDALKADDELADGYLTRIICDHTDVSLDPPPLGDLFSKHRGKELLEFAIDDFLGTRNPRRNCFFNADQFLRTVNAMASQPEIAKWFVEERDGVSLIFRALDQSREHYARVLATRTLTIFALQQDNDGVVEKKILSGDFTPNLMQCYRACTGDPTDTRYVTMLISSMIHHFPEPATRELGKCGVVKTVVEGLNISKCPGVPQHCRIISDLLQVPDSVQKKTGVPIRRQLLENDFLGVGVGVFTHYPDFDEGAGMLTDIFSSLLPETTAMEFLEYQYLTGALQYLRYHHENNPVFKAPGSNSRKIRVFLDKLASDPRVMQALSSGPRRLRDEWKEISQLSADLDSPVVMN